MREVLRVLSEDKTALPGIMEQTMAEKFAAVGAASAPKISSPIEAQRLLDALLQGENPEFTPSGRKIISIVSLEDVEKRF